MKRPSIAELIACPKTISKAVQANDDDPKHHRLDLVLKSEAPGKFQSFIRVKRAMKEHFSIGLRYLDDEGAHVVLLRGQRRPRAAPKSRRRAHLVRSPRARIPRAAT